MAKCKLCKTDIPDGKEYCSNCQDKGSSKANESYLDSLLNSVKNTTPASDSIYKKKSDNTKVETSQISNRKSNSPENSSNSEEDLLDYTSYDLDLNDINDFDQFSIDDDLKGVHNHIVIGDKELFGGDISELWSEEEPSYLKERNSELNEDNDDVNFNDKNESNNWMSQQDISTQDSNMEQPEKIGNLSEEIYSNIVDQKNEDQILEQSYTPSISQEDNELEDNELENNESEDIASDKESNFNPEELAGYVLDSDYDPDLDDLLNSLDTYQNDDFDESEDQYNDVLAQKKEPSTSEEFEQIDQDEDDFLSLLNQISSDDPVAEDVRAINELLSGTAPEQQKKASMPSDVGEVFSDALKVVSSLHDDELMEAELLGKIPDAKESGKKGKKAKVKKSKKTSKNVKPGEKAENTTKKSLWQRLFGNVKDENAAKKEPLEKKQEEGAVAPKKPGKKVKPAKGKKGAKSAEDAVTSESGGGKGQQDKDGAPVEKEDKKGKKKEKKAKKVKNKEIIQVIDEIEEEDEGRINRLGAIIVFIFFGLLAVLLYVGTNMVSYTLSIQNATNYFEKQKYTQAYGEVYGEKIKDEDIELYDKIKTVMFVEKQLNSYNNYNSLGKYPEALDSLLKGLKRYDKYIELATMLGISTDLEYVRSQILAELDREFNLSEKDAFKINSYENMTDYSMEVYDVVLENVSN